MLRILGFFENFSKEVRNLTCPHMNKRIRKILVYRIIPGLVLGVLLYYGSIYFEQRQELEEYNSFLETAATVSEIHYLASESFARVLDFDVVNREIFESTISDIVSEAQKGYDLLLHFEFNSLNIKEKELLEIATTSWLRGLEIFESSMLILVDAPNSQKIEENIATSIAELSIGDTAYAEFLTLMTIRNQDSYIPFLYEIEYIGIEDSSARFADLLVQKARESSGGLFLRRDISISAIQFEPKHIAETEDGFYVLKPEPTTLNIVVTNEGNKTEYDIVLIVLVTDEDSNTVYEKRQKEAILEPGRSKTIQLEAIKLSPGVSYEWIIKLEEVENEEEIDDNLYRVKGFVPLDS